MARLLDMLLRANAEVLKGWLERSIPGPPATAAFSLNSFNDEEGTFDMGEITVNDTSGPLDASVSVKDVHGHDTTPSETPEWTTSDGTVASVEQAEDGLSATVTIAGTPGAAIIQCDAGSDADGNPLVGHALVTVTASGASSVDITLTPAEEAPEEEAPAEGSE